MTHRTQFVLPWRRLGALAATTVLAGGLAIAVPTVANAATGAQSTLPERSLALTDDNGQGGWSVFASGTFDNASDPDIYRCYGPGSVYGWCMVTSRDFGGGNGAFYPMQETRAFWSADGIKWDMGLAATELQLPLKLNNGGGSRAAVQDLPMHMWAPTVRYVNKGTTANPDYQHRIYVPDVVRQSSSINNGWVNASNQDPGAPNHWDKYSSRIFLKSTRNLFSPTDNNLSASGTTADFVQVTAPFAEITDNGSTDTKKYMSDPDVFSDTTDLTDKTKDYLLWANGDWNNCGGLSIGKLNEDGTRVTGPAGSGSATDPLSYRVTINGLPSEWGIESANGCGTNSGSFPHPNPLYFEGPSLYLASELGMGNAQAAGVGRYVMVFPVKPVNAPAACSGSNNQAMVWASSNAVGGPYTYGNIIHCGSGVSWTNHGSMTTIPTVQGRQQLVFIGHDQRSGESGYNRKLRSECVYFVNDARMVPSPRTLEGAASGTGTSAQRNWCLSHSEPLMLANKAISFPTSFNAVHTDGWGNWLEAVDRGRPGSGWASQAITADTTTLFAMDPVFNGGGSFGLHSRATGDFWTVSRNQNNNQVSAMISPFLNDWEQYTRTVTTNGSGTAILDSRGWPLCKENAGAGIHAEQSPNSWQSSQGVNALPTRCKWAWTWLQ